MVALAAVGSISVVGPDRQFSFRRESGTDGRSALGIPVDLHNTFDNFDRHPRRPTNPRGIGSTSVFSHILGRAVFNHDAAAFIRFFGAVFLLATRGIGSFSTRGKSRRETFNGRKFSDHFLGE